jgi:hypothetical protein
MAGESMNMQRVVRTWSGVRTLKLLDAVLVAVSLSQQVVG